MAILEILKFPDPRLRHKGRAVPKVTPELKQLAEDMLETMYSFKGIGLAAIQVDREVRLLVTDVRPKENGRYKPGDMTELEQAVGYPLVMFNPVITKREGKTTYDEGCLSIPSYYETIERANYVEVDALTSTASRSRSRPMVCCRSASSTRSITWTASCSWIV